MRKRYYAAAAAAASVAATLAGPVAAEAATPTGVTVCWTAPTGSANYPITVALDGTNSRSGTIQSGDCRVFHARPGDYKVVWSNLDTLTREFYASLPHYPNYDYATWTATTTAICGTPTSARYPGWDNIDPRATVKRFNNAYVTTELNNVNFVRTTVQRHHQTRINFRMTCQAFGYYD